MRTALVTVLSFVAALLLAVVYNLFQPGQVPVSLPETAYSDFVHAVDAGHIKAVTLHGPSLTSVDDEDRPASLAARGASGTGAARQVAPA